MRVPKGPTHQQSTLQAIQAAMGTVRRDAVLPWVLSGYAALFFLGPSSALILPVYAVKILHIGPELLGLLFSSAGVGTIVGALFLASLGSSPRRGLIYLAGIFIWVAALTGFAVSRTVLDFHDRSAGLRDWSDAGRNHDHKSAANPRAGTDAGTIDEPEYAAHHGHPAVRRFSRRRLDRGNRGAGNGVAECIPGWNLWTWTCDAARDTFNLARARQGISV